MITRLDHDPHEPPSSIRTDARLDTATRANVDELAQHFGRPRAAVLCQILAWGLSRGPTGPFDQGEAQGPVRHLYVSVASDLHARVEKAAIAAGVKVAPWLHHMVRQMTLADFPASWQEARLEKRSHDSRTYGTRFMLRLDHLTAAKLEEVSSHFDIPAAEIIRQLIAQAAPEDFPKSWQMRAAERRTSWHRRSPRVPVIEAGGGLARSAEDGRGCSPEKR